MNPFMEPYNDDLLKALDATLARVRRDMDRINAETWAKAKADGDILAEEAARVGVISDMREGEVV